MIDFTIDDGKVKALQRAFEKAPQIAFREVRNGLVRVSEGFRTQHTKTRLRGRPGLIIRNGNAGLGGASFTDVDGDRLDRLEVNTFFGPQVKKYAEVQEHGTVGAGGSLPDIVPKRAKVLRFEIDGQVVFAKRVAIPPRLGWLDTWDDREERRRAQFEEMLDRVVQGVADAS